MNDVKGANAEILAITSVPGSVTSVAGSPVPEPTAAVTFSAGLGLMGWAVSRQRSSTPTSLD